MKYCPIDSSAGAFYILDHGYTGMDAGTWELELTVHVILKILNKSEFGQADISISHHRSDKINNFKASTFNLEDGKIVEDKISKKDALIEVVDEDTKEFNFTFPNIREGSVLEYKYTVKSGNWLRLNTWYFQSRIPALKSHYEVSIPEYMQYKRLMTGYIPLTKASVTQGHGYTKYLSFSTQEHDYLIENVPSFKEEVHMGTVRDNIAKIDFELKSRNIPGETTVIFLEDSYLGLAQSLAKEDEFIFTRENSMFAKEKAFSFIDGEKDGPALASEIYYAVRDEFIESYEVDNKSLQKAFENKTGTGSEINRVLGAMLTQAGFEVNLVLLSTRSNGKIHESYPIATRLNHSIVKASFAGQTFIMDASDKRTPFGVLPKYCLNGKGLVIDEQPTWIDLKPFKTNKTTYGGQFYVTSDATLEGNLTIRRYGYEAWDFLNEVRKEGKIDYIANYNKNRSTWNVSKHEVSDLKKDLMVDQSIELEIEDNIDDLDEIVYLNPLLIAPMESNPFKAESRIYPVDFGVHFSVVHSFKFIVDESYTIDEVPKPERILLPNKAGSMQYNVSVFGNEITVTSTYQIKKAEFFSNEYPYLREFYAAIVEKHGEQIVLRRI